jgi:aryl-alcohol dehydrogenase-like predicted oxidoreductase
MIPRRSLGRTKLEVPSCSLGCGPIPQLMTGQRNERQVALLERALQQGIDWLDTAATYGDGSSEKNLGWSLAQLDGAQRMRVATKVRLMPDQLDDIATAVRASVERSLENLGIEKIVLLQLHNSITAERGDEPTSLTPDDILADGGILSAIRQLQDEGLVGWIGLTGLGQPAAIKRVVLSGQFDTIQVPYSLVNSTAGRAAGAGFDEADYGELIEPCAEQGMGVFVIRVFAGGALLGHPPAPHTYTTRFFPIDLYERDLARADRVRQNLAGDEMDEVALRFALFHPQVNSAIVGMSEPEHVDRALVACEKGPLPDEHVERLLAAAADI